MKTTRTALAALMTLAFLTAFSGPAAAQGPGMHGMRGMTLEQQTVMQQMHNDFNTATAELRKELFAAQAALDAELYAPKPDDKKIASLTERITTLESKIFAERVAMRKAMAAKGIMPMGRMGGMGDCPMMQGGMMGGRNGMRGGMMQHGAMQGMRDCPMTGSMSMATPDNGTAAPAAGMMKGMQMPAQQ